jgi:hypothetical protein
MVRDGGKVLAARFPGHVSELARALLPALLYADGGFLYMSYTKVHRMLPIGVPRRAT